MNTFEIAWYGTHCGEEPPISGSGGLARRSPDGHRDEGGSGTIFFCRCNLKCVYCQNWQISQERIFCDTVSEIELLEIMLKIQENGCHNINLVSPVIWSSRLRQIIKQAKKKDLKIPIIWNTNAYETLASLKKLEGIADIYLPDYKYDDESLAIKYSNAPRYPKLAREAILEMYRQVGDLVTDEDGIAQKGLIVRHLVLPGQLENTHKCLRFIRSISNEIHLSLMSQYNPTYRAKDFPEINRVLIKDEFDKVLAMVEELDFKNGWVQEFEDSTKCLNPDFSKENPFGAD